jgi:predicted Zn-dependent protease
MMRRVSLFILMMFSIGCVTIYNPATQRKEIYFIDDSAEILIGKNLTSQILRENKVIKDENLIAYLRGIGGRVARVSDREYLKYNFFILEGKELNAFSLPGGYIFVNKGLIDRANKDELAFVLAHEIAHVCARHAVKKLQVSLGMSLILNLALRNPKYIDIKRGIDVVYDLITLGYSRSDELLADSLGVTYSYKAGFDPNGAITLLDKLRREGKGYIFVFLSSHPPPNDRIKNVKNKIEELLSPNEGIGNY